MQKHIQIRERTHRLPREVYTGNVNVAFTLCMKRRLKPAATTDISNIVDISSAVATQNIRQVIEFDTMNVFIDILASVAEQNNCIVPVYCFMPDHQHLIISGKNEKSDLWKTIVDYKQKTGFWMSKCSPEIQWQKDFYDHVIRKDESIITQVRYILDNPVRKGLALAWSDYPFKGSLGCTLEDVLNFII